MVLTPRGYSRERGGLVGPVSRVAGSHSHLGLGAVGCAWGTAVPLSLQPLQEVLEELQSPWAARGTQCPPSAYTVGGMAQRCPSPFAGELLPSLPPAHASCAQPEPREQREEEEGRALGALKPP